MSPIEPGKDAFPQYQFQQVTSYHGRMIGRSSVTDLLSRPLHLFVSGTLRDIHWEAKEHRKRQLFQAEISTEDSLSFISRFVASRRGRAEVLGPNILNNIFFV